MFSASHRCTDVAGTPVLAGPSNSVSSHFVSKLAEQKRTLGVQTRRLERQQQPERGGGNVQYRSVARFEHHRCGATTTKKRVFFGQLVRK